MAKIIRSLNMEAEVWKRLEDQANLMKKSRSELCEEMFAEAFGFFHLLPKINPVKLKDSAVPK